MKRFEHFPPDAHCFVDNPSHARPGIHPLHDRLHVLTMLENPLRWRSRYQNFSNFAAMIQDSGAILHVAEIALGAREFEITEKGNPLHLQLRSNCEFWHKENALNLLAATLPSDCKYIGVFDADIEFARRDWAQEILHQLQHYDVIQPFDQAINLAMEDTYGSGPVTSFTAQWMNHGIAPHAEAFVEDRPVHWTQQGVISDKDWNGGMSPGAAVGWHPGLAWAYRKSAWDALGGMMDWLPTGSGDWHMANALIGNLVSAVDERHTESYKRHCRIWQERAIQHVRDNPNGGLGNMKGLLLHRAHGTYGNRQYQHRHKFVINVEFDPDLDLKRDWQGLWQLTDRSPKLRDGLRMYARMRDEDSR